MTVWKTTISAIEQRITISIPKGSKFLAVKAQHGDIAIWYAVPDTNALKVSVDFLVCTTGAWMSLPFEIQKYWGTVQEEGYVLHVFEILSENDK